MNFYGLVERGARWAQSVKDAMHRSRLCVLLLSEPTVALIGREPPWDTTQAQIEVAADCVRQQSMHILPVYVGQVWYLMSGMFVYNIRLWPLLRSCD
jgi:hypothetical protein